MSQEEAVSFATQFFSDLNNLLEKKRVRVGGKRKSRRRRKHRGGGNDTELVLPVPLDASNRQKLDTLQSNRVQAQVRLTTPGPSRQLSSKDYTKALNAEFAQHIQSLLDNIGTKPAIEMSPEELHVLALFIQYKTMKADVSATSQQMREQLSPLQTMDKSMVQDAESDDNVQKLSQALAHVPANSPDLVDKQVWVIQEVTNHTVQEMEDLATSYERNADSHELSSRATSGFVNIFGRASVLLNLLASYKNRVSTFFSDLKTRNSLVYHLMNALLYAIHSLLYWMFRLFLFLLNTFVGKAFLVGYFIYLYQQNNEVAVFLANLFMQLMTKADSAIGATRYMGECMGIIQQHVKQFLLMLLSDATIGAFFKTSLTESIFSAFNNPAALPVITEGFRQGLLEATPEIVSQMSVPLIQGVSHAVTGAIETSAASAVTGAIQSSAVPMLESAVTTTMTQIAQNAAANAATNAAYSEVMKIAGKAAISYGLSAVASQFGLNAITDAIPSITNSGGSRSIRRGKTRRYKRRRGNKVTHKRRR